MAENWDKCMCVAVKLCDEVSRIIRERIWCEKSDVQTKAHKHDFVTETDQQIEKLLITGLSSEFPDHRFIGEETTSTGIKAELTDAPTWIIDPVDGTLNFVHGYPNVCVSIGLAFKKELILGIIAIPVSNMIFTAIKGEGAFLNSTPIHVSKTINLQDALLAMEVSGAGADSERFDTMFKQLQAFLPRVHGIRSAGSAAYNMAMVALGGADGYFEIGIHAWDIAAGTVIVREAGGVVMDPSGMYIYRAKTIDHFPHVNGGKLYVFSLGEEELDVMNRRVLCASTKELAVQISKHIIQMYPTPDGKS